MSIELHNLNSEYEQSLDEKKSHSPKESPKEDHSKQKAKTPTEKRKNSPKDSPKDAHDPKDVTLTISKGVPPEKCDVRHFIFMYLFTPGRISRNNDEN